MQDLICKLREMAAEAGIAEGFSIGLSKAADMLFEYSKLQPIKFAPKDETKFIGWNKEYGFRETYYRFYEEGTIARSEYENGFGPQGYYDWSEPISNWGSSWKPTHFMAAPNTDGLT
jgi:hypothetical protein